LSSFIKNITSRHFGQLPVAAPRKRTLFEPAASFNASAFSTEENGRTAPEAEWPGELQDLERKATKTTQSLPLTTTERLKTPGSLFEAEENTNDSSGKDREGEFEPTDQPLQISDVRQTSESILPIAKVEKPLLSGPHNNSSTQNMAASQAAIEEGGHFRTPLSGKLSAMLNVSQSRNEESGETLSKAHSPPYKLPPDSIQQTKANKIVELRSLNTASTQVRTGFQQKQQSGQAPLPKVKIHIGKIEVKAANPKAGPPPKPRKKASMPKLSLEEYLKKRTP